MNKLGVLVGDKGNWKFFYEIFDDLKCHYEIVLHHQPVYEIPLLHGRLNRWAYRNSIESVLRRSEVAFFEWASDLLIAASQMKKYCPIIARLHSYELFAWAPHVRWENVDKVILVSKAMEEKFNSLYPGNAHKTQVIYNGKPLDLFKPVERPFQFHLGMLGQINPRKRIYEIILMLAELRELGYDAHLHIAGGRHPVPDMDEYYVATHLLVDKLRLNHCVTFYEHVTDPSNWLKNIDIFISNSYWEGHQVALVEAMSMGCYCLSHFWDGVEEVLPANQIYVSENELLKMIVDYSQLPAAEKCQRQAYMRSIATEKYDLHQQTVAIRGVIDQCLQVA